MFFIPCSFLLRTSLFGTVFRHHLTSDRHMSQDQGSQLVSFLSLCCFLLVSILKSSTFLVVNAQRGFGSPPACDKYSVVDRHSPRVCLLLYANIAFSLHLPFPRLIWYINVFNGRGAEGVGSKPCRWRNSEGGACCGLAAPHWSPVL